MVYHAVPLNPTGLFLSLHHLLLESMTMDDLDACPDLDAAMLHSLDVTPLVSL
jgi:hypothetical protein